MRRWPITQGVAAAALIGLGGIAGAQAPEPAPSTPASPPAATVPAAAPAPEESPVDLGVIELDTATTPQGALEAVPEPEGDEDATEEHVDEDPGESAADALSDGSLLDLPGLGSAVPFAISDFRIPLFLLPIYQAAGIEYGVRWEVLAAINEIETDYGRNLNVSSAGAVGWMQFMPATWKAYGVDANRDGRKNPYDPVDAIFAAARYLEAAGFATDLRGAIFAYNHADWYVNDVLARARLIAALPEPLIGSLTGMADGLFPVHAPAQWSAASPAPVTWAAISAAPGAPAVAVQTGKVTRIGENERLGRFVELRDVYGTTYTYAHLGGVAERYPHPRQSAVSAEDVRKELGLPASRGTAPLAQGPRPLPPQSVQLAAAMQQASGPVRQFSTAGAATGEAVVPAAPEDSQVDDNLEAAAEAGAVEGLELPPGTPASATLRPAEEDVSEDAEEVGDAEAETAVQYVPAQEDLLQLDADDVTWRTLEPGSTVVAGTVLGSVGDRAMRFAVQPVGEGAPRIDPRPLLDGWLMLERSRLFRVRGRAAGIGQALLLDRPALGRLVLADERITVYGCGRDDIANGIIDRRVLAALVYLADAGLHPTVTSLRCGHGYLTASGNVSHHSSGDAVDIAAINGIPIIGHQGAGSITDSAVRRLLRLQGTMQPDQIITLMTYPGATNTYAMGDHHDHIHVGWRPRYDGGGDLLGEQARAVLEPGQWTELAERLGRLRQPRLGAEDRP